MGQEQSVEEAPPQTPEQLSTALAHRFAEKCFTSLELAHYKDNFRTRADLQDGLAYWKESTLKKFLVLPDALEVGPVMFQIASYLGAFPFLSLAPAILTREALVKVVVLMTGRYERVLKHGQRDRLRLLFRSMAVFDRRASSLQSPHPAELVDALRRDKEAAPEEGIASPSANVQGFDVDRPQEDDESDDEDALALAALESLDALEAFPASEPLHKIKLLQAQIPLDNFRRLLMYLLLIATLESQENIEKVSEVLLQQRMRTIRQVADAILWTFAPEDNPGIAWGPFRRIVNNSVPFLFDSLNPLFEHFLFSKNLNLHRRTSSTMSSPRTPRNPGQLKPPEETEPVLPRESELMDLTTLSQLSFFIKSSEIFRHLRLLYSGADAGFSIQSITHKILNWRAPTILLVAGSRLESEPSTPRERSFAASLPPRRYPDGTSGNALASPRLPTAANEVPAPDTTRLVFGAYLSQPWKQTPKTPLTDSTALLFQLLPLHDVFRASSVDTSHFTLNSSGLGFGCPMAMNQSNPAIVSHRSSSQLPPAPLGAVSLWLDANLEFGVFTHTAAGGGAFAPSVAGRGDWQERFEIESLEVWGCGGDEEAARQRMAWAWEEREAEARRTVKLGTGDRDADYALLELAGLVGGAGNSGGSMG